MGDLRTAAERLDEVDGIADAPRFQAACHLVRTLASAMEQCLDASMDESVLVAGLPSDVVTILDAQLASEVDEHQGGSEQRGGVGEPAVQTPTSQVQRFLTGMVGWGT